MLDVSRSPSKKQIRTSKISNSRVLARKLKTVNTDRATNEQVHEKRPIHNKHQMNDVKNHVGCLSRSIKKAHQDIENIRFYSLGWPTEKQSTLAGLPTSRCMKKAPFRMNHHMNNRKNYVGCLSKYIKKADQDLKDIRFYSLGWPTEKQSTLAGVPTSRCIKKLHSQ